MAKPFWLRWFGWLFGRSAPKKGRIPQQDTLARRLDSAVRGSKERDLLRGAEASLSRGRRDEAVRAYEAALAVFESRGAYQKAVAVLTTLTRLRPDEARYYEQLAAIQEQLGRRIEAEIARRQAAAILDEAGAHTRALAIRQTPVAPAREPEGLHVERVRAAPARPTSSPQTAFSGGARPHIPAAVSEVGGPLDLGEFEASLDEERPITLAPEALDPTSDATVAMSAIRREDHPELSATSAREGSGRGIASAQTDPADVPGGQADQTAGGSGFGRPELGDLTMSPLQPQGVEEEFDDDYDDYDEGDVGDQTLYDPGFVAAHQLGGPRGLALPVTDVRPTRTGGPRGLAIPGASTVVDPRGAGARDGQDADDDDPRPSGPRSRRR